MSADARGVEMRTSPVFLHWSADARRRYCGEVSSKHPDSAVGFVAAALSLVAGVAAPCLARLARSHGRGAPVVVAALCYAGLGALFLGLGGVDPVTSLGCVWVVAALQGICRCVFENSAKMIVLEQFRHTSVEMTNAAMASIYFHSGVASTGTFVALSWSSYGALGGVYLGCAAAVWAGYAAAERRTRALLVERCDGASARLAES